MFGDVVLGIDHDEFEHEIFQLKRRAGVKVGDFGGGRLAVGVGPAALGLALAAVARRRSKCRAAAADWMPSARTAGAACTCPLSPPPLNSRNGTRPPCALPPPQFDCELDASHLRELVAAYKEVYARNKLALPQDPWEQLRMGIDAVFR
jgi:hypothetical protein